MVSRLDKTISNLVVAAGGAILCLMMVQIVVDVFMRNVMGAGFPATAELVSKYYMVAVSFIPVAYAELKRRHIEATIFTDALRGWPRQIVAWLGIAIATVVFALMAYVAFGEAAKQTGRGTYVEVGTTVFQTWPSYWIPFVSFTLIGVVLLIRLYQLATGQFILAGHDPLKEIDASSKEQM